MAFPFRAPYATCASEMTRLFEAKDDNLRVALNEAYIRLLEFVHDRELRRSDAVADRRAPGVAELCRSHHRDL